MTVLRAQHAPMVGPLDEVSAAVIDRHLTHLRNRGLAPAYIDSRRRLLRSLSVWAGCPLLEMTHEDLDRWQTVALATRSTGRSRNTVVSHAREFFKWAQDNELTVDDRGRRLVRSKMSRLVPRPIGEATLAAALARAPNRVRPMLYLAAYEGLRACEIANLRREDVRDDQEQPTLVVRGKGDKERLLPLSPRVLEALRDADLPARGHLFRMHDTNGQPTTRPITPHRVSAACNGYLAEVGAGSTLHALRHYFGTSLYMISKDIRLTQEAMGHASPATTAIYAGFDTSRTAGYMRQIADARPG